MNPNKIISVDLKTYDAAAALYALLDTCEREAAESNETVSAYAPQIFGLARALSESLLCELTDGEEAAA